MNEDGSEIEEMEEKEAVKVDVMWNLNRKDTVG